MARVRTDIEIDDHVRVIMDRFGVHTKPKPSRWPCAIWPVSL